MFRSGRDTKNNQTSLEPKVNSTPTPVTPPSGASSSSATAYASAGPTPTTLRAMTETESLARDIKEGVLTGFVGSGTKLTGDVTFKGMLRIDGHFTGRINSEDGTLLVGTSGQIDANMDVAVATIHGIVNGDIVATRRIDIGRTAKIVGNIQTPSLVVEQGGIFEGSCRMVQLKQAIDKQHAEEAQAAANSLMARDADESSNLPDVSDVAS